MNAPFDTLKLAQGFQVAGMEAPTAQGSAEAIAVAMSETNFATKDDLRLTEEKLRHEIGSLRTEVKADIAILRTELKADMEMLRRDMTIKLGGIMTVGVGVILAAMRFMPHL